MAYSFDADKIAISLLFPTKDKFFKMQFKMLLKIYKNQMS